MTLETTYLGLALAHPVIAGASPLSATLDGIRRLEDAGAAAIVTASLYEEEVQREEEALAAASLAGAESHPEVTHYLPPLCGCRSARAAHVETIRRAAECLSVPLIASLSGTTREGWIGMAADLQDAGAAALELNVVCIPTDPAESAADVERRLIETVRDVRAAVQIPVAVKLGPHFSAPAHLASALAAAGANGIVLFNRHYEPDIDLASMTLHPSLELSARRDIRFPLRWIALLAGKTPLSLAASSGVEGAAEVVKYLLAGADAVQTVAALLRHGPAYLRRLTQGLTEWLDAHGAAGVADIRGRMSALWLAHPAALVRAQHTPSLLLECPCRDVAPEANASQAHNEPLNRGGP